MVWYGINSQRNYNLNVQNVGTLLPTLGITTDSISTLESAASTGSYLDCFSLLDICKFTSVVSHSNPSTCLPDPIPSRLFKDGLPIIGSVILDLVNASLLTGIVPRAFKIAVI